MLTPNDKLIKNKKENNPILLKMNSRIFYILMFILVFSIYQVNALIRIEQWNVFETTFISDRKYNNPFLDVEVDVLFSNGKQQWVVPAFWTGGKKWMVRFAPPVQGEYQYQVVCTDTLNAGLNGRA